MSKVVAVVAAGSGATAASVGGIYILQKGSGAEATKNPQDNKEIAPVTLSNALDFNTLTEFKTKEGGDCAKKYFGGLNYGTSEGSSIGTTESITDGDLPKTPSTGEEPKSCLVINWERSDSKDSVSTENKKGKGNFRGLGSFVNGDKGFVIFSTTKLSKQDNQFDLEGGIYFLAKEGSEESNKTGKIKKHKEVSDTSKNITKSNFEQSFPKIGNNLDGTEASKLYGGFMEDSGDLDKLCKDGDTNCPQDPKDEKPFKAAGEGSTDTSKTQTTPNTGSQSFYENLKGLFGEEGLSHLSNAFDGFKGHWKKVNPSNS